MALANHAARTINRPFLFGTNFKMHQSPADSLQFFDQLSEALVERKRDAQLFLIPPFTSLSLLAERAAGSNIWIGAQTMHWANEGAFTGEISPSMLRAVGVNLVLLGHAERRRYFNETDTDLKKKVFAAMAAGFQVLLCVGETAEDMNFGVGLNTITRQLRVALHELDATAISHLLIAYEPVWSIGEGGTPAQPADIIQVIAHIRGLLHDMFGGNGSSVPLLYGGSVDEHNAGSFAQVHGLNGLFVGRAAWQVPGFLRVLDAALSAPRSAYSSVV